MMLYAKRIRRAGFTLIEIMIVIAIIAILAGIAIPNIREAGAEAQLTACAENCKTIFNAIQMATTRMSDKEFREILGSGRFATSRFILGPEALEYLVKNGFLGQKPCCPFAPKRCSSKYSIDCCVGDGYMLEGTNLGRVRTIGWLIQCPFGYDDTDGTIFNPVYSQNYGVLIEHW